VKRWLSWRFLVPFAALYLGVHIASIVWSGSHAVRATYIFQLLAPWIAFLACCYNVGLSSSRTRFYWGLLAVALFLWCTGMSLAAWDDLIRPDASDAVAGYSDIAYYLYGLPVLLAVASPTREERRSLFIWLDAAQAIVTAILVYVTFFSVVPFMRLQDDPVPVTVVAQADNIENIFLACGATLRLFTLTDQGERRHYFRILAGFLWIYAIFAGLYNHLFIVLGDRMGVYNALSVVPFLFLSIALVIPFQNEENVVPIHLEDRPVSLFIENASPVFYTIALFLLAIVQIRHHFHLGVGTLALALVIYAIRAITLQGRYMRSERSLREARNWLQSISLQDGLTGISNRRHFDDTLQSEWNRGIRTKQPLSLLLLDIDHFKILNDTYGHLAGDRCLVEIAAALRELVPRSGDLLARYGGEEFAVILTSTDSAGAQLLADRIRIAISRLNIAESNAALRTVTLSAGVATVRWPSHKTSPQQLIDEADRALYTAKRNGRNRVEIFSEIIVPVAKV
jgi:diguanylate cyclase (GGDEF)-like protein